MTKKLISYDDEAVGGGLPEVVKEELKRTYGSIHDVPLTPYMFGALEPRVNVSTATVRVDNTPAISAMWAEAKRTKRPVHFPARRSDGQRARWDYLGDPLETFSGMHIMGDGIGTSLLIYDGTGEGLFRATETNHHWLFERISIASNKMNADVFHFDAEAGISVATFRGVAAYLNSGGAAATGRIWDQDGPSDHIQVNWDSDCILQAPPDTITVPYRVRVTTGGANCNSFRGVRFNGLNNPHRPFVEIDSANPTAYANDWIFDGLVGEQNVGGLIRMKGAQGATVIQSSDEDAAIPYTGDIFSFVDNDEGLASDNITLIHAVRRGSSVPSGVFDIKVSSRANAVTVIGCNPTPTSQAPRLSLPPGATIVGTRNSANAPSSQIQGLGKRQVLTAGAERRIPLAYYPDPVNFTFQSFPKGEVRFMPVAPVRNVTVRRVAVFPTVAATGGTATLRFGLWSSNAAGLPGDLAHNLGDVTVDLTTGAGGEAAVALPVPVSLLSNNLYWVGCWWTGTATTNPTLYGVSGTHPAVGTMALSVQATAYRQVTDVRPDPAVPDSASARAGIMVWAHL